MTQAAKDLTRNPLGVIGLFIVLVYGFACLVLSYGAGVLETHEKMPIIIFTVLFPLLILRVFYLLVTDHHKKLYAPSDYKDEKLFHYDLPEDLDNYSAHVSQSDDNKIIELKSKNKKLAKINSRQRRTLEKYKKTLEQDGNESETDKEKLSILKNILSPDKKANSRYSLIGILESGDRQIEDSVIPLYNSQDIQEFLKKLGFKIKKTEDDSIIKKLYSDETKEYKKYDVSMASWSTKGWFAITDSMIHMNQGMYDQLSEEFTEIKNQK